MRRILALLPLFALGVAGVPTGTIDKEGVVRFAYDYGQPPAIVCAPTITCDLELQSGEVVGDIVSGDSVRRDPAAGWIIAQGMQGSVPHIYVSPMKPSGITNLLVTTNRRPYALYLVATTTSHVQHWRYGFAYPAPPAIAVVSPAPEPTATATPQPRNYGFNVGGNAPFRPRSVYSVGDETYVELPDGDYARPTVVAVQNGQRIPIAANFESEANRLVIFGDYPHLLLYVGDGKNEQHVTVDKR